jgi:hypothetical protein
MLITVKNVDNSIQTIDLSENRNSPYEIDTVKNGVLNAIAVGMSPFVPRNDLDFYPKQPS